MSDLMKRVLRATLVEALRTADHAAIERIAKALGAAAAAPTADNAAVVAGILVFVSSDKTGMMRDALAVALETLTDEALANAHRLMNEHLASEAKG